MLAYACREDNLGSPRLYADLIGLDYSLVNRMGMGLGNAVIDIVQGAVGLGEMVFDGVVELSQMGVITDSTPALEGMLEG